MGPDDGVRLCIADPPYPPQTSERRDRPDGPIRTTVRTRARRWYGDANLGSNARPADFHPAASEWDDPERHAALLDQLMTEFDGWAIATTIDGIHHYGTLPAPARILIWHRPNAIPTGRRILTTCEAVILYPPEHRRARRPGTPMVPDHLTAVPPNAGFIGAKPVAWTRWVLDALDYRPDVDQLVDLFPGSGAVAAAAAQGVLL